MFRGGGASSQSSQAAVPARVKLMQNISQSLFCKSTQSTALWGVQSRGKVTWYAKICQGSFYVIFINETCATSGRCVKVTALIETRQGMMRRWRKNGGRKRTRRRPCWIYSVNDFQMCGDFNNMSQTQAKTTFRSQKLAPGKLLVPLRMKKMIKNEAHFTSVLHDFSEAFVTGKFCDVKVVCKVLFKNTESSEMQRKDWEESSWEFREFFYRVINTVLKKQMYLTQDTNLWAHQLILGSVSPFLRSLLIDFERRGDDVITIFLPFVEVSSCNIFKFVN